MRHNVSLMRQGVITKFDPKPGCSIATLSYEYTPGFLVPEHAHGSDQVIYATRGVMEVASGQSLWIIPPHFAIWIPATTMHRIRMPGAVSMRTLYLRRGVKAHLPRECTVLHVTPLLRELIVEAVSIGRLKARDRLHCALRDLLVARLEKASPVPTNLRLPIDERAMAVAQELLSRLDEAPSLLSLCESAGVSVRTIERVFSKEVGTDFETWRTQARLMRAVEKLLAGDSVKQVAFDVGYRQPSAFVEMFRRTLGSPPKSWVRKIRGA